MDENQTDEEVSNNMCAVIYFVLVLLFLVQFSATRPTVLIFHGNGGNHGHRIPLAKVFYIKMRCNVLMLSYRGCAPIPVVYESWLICTCLDTAIRRELHLKRVGVLIKFVGIYSLLFYRAEVRCADGSRLCFG